MQADVVDRTGPCPQCNLRNSHRPFHSSHSVWNQIRKYSSQTHYDVLGIDPKASPEEIKSAFLKQSKLVHPDKNRGKPVGDSHDKFVRLNAAYMVLSKESSRQEYDMILASLRSRSQFRSSSYNHYTTSGSRTGFDSPGGGKERVFWDETIWHMRDKSKDKMYEGTSYYGIKGVKKVPNSYIVFACVGLIASGVLLHFMALSQSRRMNNRILDEKDRQNNRLHVQAKKRAKLHGNALQLELLKSRIQEESKAKEEKASKD